MLPSRKTGLLRDDVNFREQHFPHVVIILRSDNKSRIELMIHRPHFGYCHKRVKLLLCFYLNFSIRFSYAFVATSLKKSIEWLLYMVEIIYEVFVPLADPKTLSIVLKTC